MPDIVRRVVVTLLSGAAVWPLAARAQKGERMRRIGVIMGFAEDDAVGRPISRPFAKPCKSWAGPMGATSPSTIASAGTTRN
jgi:hypothetical protein